jgi:hypothetical protein
MIIPSFAASVVSLALALTAASSATHTSNAAGAHRPHRDAWTAHLRSAGHAAEVRRIQRHFDSVLVALQARDVSALPATQRARRQALIASLRAYRDRGAFPHNHDFAGQAVPYFVDRETGILCAVAHLLAVTGRRDIVDRVASADNNVWVPQLAGDTAVAAWLDAQGLTLAEAAHIQVPYEGDGSGMAAAVTRSPLSFGATLAGGAALGSAIWNATANTHGRQRVSNVLGVAAGVTAVSLGAAGVSEGGVSPVLTAGSVVVGATSVWLSTRGIRRHRHEQRLAAAQRATREAPRTSVAPILPVGGGASGVGASVVVRF